MFETKFISIIEEFVTDGIVYGTYFVEGLYSGERKNKVFIRNGDSIGTVTHFYGEPASKCIGEIRDDVKEDFLKKLSILKGDN